MDKSKYLIRYKCCFYDNGLVKHFKVYEALNRDEVRKQIDIEHDIPIDDYLEEEVVAPGIKYIHKM
jgi:hypothetical protein